MSLTNRDESSMNIAIVNDVETSTHVLRHIMEREPTWNIIWTAKNGAEAVEKCSHKLPDMILMDLLMPVMNGVEATRQIMQNSPCAILVVTAGVDKNAPLVYEALGSGALDAVDMPGSDNKSIQALLDKVHSLIKRVHHAANKVSRPVPIVKHKIKADSEQWLVAIGASTGGPAAVNLLLQQLPSDFPAGIVLIQHVDMEFSEGMANWLDTQLDLKVRVARKGDSPQPGTVLVASTNNHLVLTDKGTLEYTEDPVGNVYRPSVDEFYASAALYWPGNIIGVLLTGMGCDGAHGLLALRRLGYYTLTQTEKTCVVYGMPQAAMQCGGAVRQLSPEEIGQHLLELTGLNMNTETAI